jgi:hypothetical protein
MLLDLRYEATENFVSYDGYDYYRYGTGKWITFNNNIFGYVVTAEEDTRLLDLSNAVKIVNRAFVVKNKDSEMRAACQSGDTQFINVKDHQYKQLDEDRVQVDLIGSSTLDYAAKCEVVFNLWNAWELESAVMTGAI